jgi:hypothetical protein
VTKRSDWEWSGSAGHFIGSASCLFHLSTDVGHYRVSTIGEYLPRGAKEGSDFQDVGWDRKYETMVFPLGDDRCSVPGCDCGEREVAEWRELDFEGYNRRGDAQRGHMAMCQKWARKGKWKEGDNE